jgi:hypothetical protein
MVYTKVMIIQGSVVNIDDLKSLAKFLKIKIANEYEFETEFEYIHEELIDKINESFSHWELKVYNYPCCSDLLSKVFIVGRKTNSYYRLNIKCDKCPRPHVCDICLGITENGPYDVINISNNVVEAKYICIGCSNDKRKNINCNRCFCETLSTQGYKIKNNKSIDDRIMPWLGNRKLAYYYMIVYHAHN